jgi:hypothetical protein
MPSTRLHAPQSATAPITTPRIASVPNRYGLQPQSAGCAGKASVPTTHGPPTMSSQQTPTVLYSPLTGHATPAEAIERLHNAHNRLYCVQTHSPSPSCQPTIQRNTAQHSKRATNRPNPAQRRTTTATMPNDHRPRCTTTVWQKRCQTTATTPNDAQPRRDAWLAWLAARCGSFLWQAHGNVPPVPSRRMRRRN